MTKSRESNLLSWKFWAGMLISLLAFWLALRGVHLHQVWDALLQADYAYLVPAFLLLLVAIGTKVARWEILFYPNRGIPYKHLLAAMGIGYLGNNILPARIGELIRAYVIGESASVSKAQALATIVVERLLDVLTLLLFLAFLLPALKVPAWMAQSFIVVGIAAPAATLVLALVSGVERWLMAATSWLEKKASFLARLRLSDGVEGFMVGLEILRRKSLLPALAGWSIFSWVASGLSYYVVMLAFHIHQPVTTAFLVLCVTSLGMVVPSSPGYVGVFHYLTVVVLDLLGVPKDLALSYALVLHATVYITLSVTGIYGMFVESLGWRELAAGRVGEQ